LFGVEHPIFSAEVRAYLRFKHPQDNLGTRESTGFGDIPATPHLINHWLVK